MVWIKSVYPSGFARAASSVPILPEAPLRLSITTGCERLSDKRGATRRATTSTLPPGGKATTRRTGLAGEVSLCAAANCAAGIAAPRKAAIRTILFTMPCPRKLSDRSGGPPRHQQDHAQQDPRGRQPLEAGDHFARQPHAEQQRDDGVDESVARREAARHAREQNHVGVEGEQRAEDHEGGPPEHRFCVKR